MKHNHLRKIPDSLPMQLRAEGLSGSIIDAEKRTVNLVWTTGAPVKRRRYSGWDTVVNFEEVLLVSNKAIDLTRMNSGAPVLDNHRGYESVKNAIAIVDKAWIDGDVGRAIVRFPVEGTDLEADKVFNKINDPNGPIIKNVSVGYSIDKIRIEEPKKKGEIERVIVERWTPYEISFVNIPADPDAQVRSQYGTYPLSLERGNFSCTAAAAARMRMAEAVRRFG